MPVFSFSPLQKGILVLQVLLLIGGLFAFTLKPRAAVSQDPTVVLDGAADADEDDGGDGTGFAAAGVDDEGGRGAVPGGIVNINTAGPEEMATIRGVGPAMAADIIAYRNGPDGELGTADDNLFNPAAELDMVKGIGPSKLARLLQYVTCGDTTSIPPWQVGGSGGVIDLNNGGVEDFNSLPGIGPVAAQKIVDYRDGPDGQGGTRDDRLFTAVDDLKNISGFGDATIEKLRPLVTVGTVRPSAGAAGAPAARLDLNAATTAQLDALPGVGPGTAQKIVADRAANGPFRSIDDLDRVSGVGPALIDKIRAQVMVNAALLPVPRPPVPAVPAAPVTPAGPLNLNTATVEQMDALPRITSTAARNLVAMRETLPGRRFTTWEQVDAVSGVGPTALETLKAQTVLR